MKKLLTPLLIISLLVLLQGCANNRTINEGDLLYSVMNTKSFSNGDKYVGELKDGHPHGKGTMTYNNGEMYKGEFKWGKHYGEGILTYPNGDKLIAEVKGGQKIKRTYIFADGRKYEGEYKLKKLHGKGTITFPDGKIQSGMWAGGVYLYDLAEHQKREEQRLILLRQKEKQKREAQLAAQKQRILSKLKPYMDDCQNIGFKVDSKKYKECIVGSI